MLKKILIIMYIFFITQLADAGILDKNLLQDCKKYGTFISDCHYTEDRLADLYPNEMKFTLHYAFDCSGHVINVGLILGSNKLIRIPFEFTDKKGKTIEFESKGPIDTYEWDEIGVPSAEFNPECSLRITHFSYDLSKGTLTIVEDIVNVAERLGALLVQIKSLESLSTAFKVVLKQIDIPAMSELIKTLLINIKSLHDGFTKIGNQEAANGVRDAIDELESAACDHPAMRERLADACNAKPNASSASIDTLSSRISKSLESISSLSKQLTDDTSRIIAENMVKAWKILIQASNSTKAPYTARICAVNKSSGNDDPACK